MAIRNRLSGVNQLHSNSTSSTMLLASVVLHASLLLLFLPSFIVFPCVGMSWNRGSRQPTTVPVIDRLPIADWLKSSLRTLGHELQHVDDEIAVDTLSAPSSLVPPCSVESCSSSCPFGGGSTCMANGECVCGQMIMSVCDSGSDGVPTSDLYVTVWPPSLLNTNGGSSSSSIFWFAVPPPAVNLVPRSEHTVNTVHVQTSNVDEKVMLIFGGSNVVDFSSLWLYDPRLNEMVGIGPAPPVSVDQDNSCLAPTETWYLYNGTVDMCTRPLSYVDVPSDGSGCPWPSARTFHSAFQIKDKFYVMGGGEDITVVFGDLWELALDQLFVDQWQLQRNSTDGLYVKPSTPRCTANWRLLTQPFTSNLTNANLNTPFPAARYAACVAILGSRMYMSGGASATDGFADIWMLDLSDTVTPGALNWLQLQPHVVSPQSPLTPPWRRAQAAYLPVYDLLIDTTTASLVVSPSVSSSTTPTMWLYVAGQDLVAEIVDRGIWVMAPCSGLTVNSPERSNCSDTDVYWNTLNLSGIDRFPHSDDTTAAVALFNGQFFVAGLESNEEAVANTFIINLFPPAGNITVYTPPSTPSYVLPDYLSASSCQAVTGRLTPPGRQHFGLCTFNNIAWMIGGVNTSAYPVNDGVWSYDITSDVWTQLFPSGGIPDVASRLPSNGCDARGNMWQFFGFKNAHVLIMIPDVWKYSTITNRWSNVTDMQSSSVPFNEAVYGNIDGLWAIGATYANGYLFPIQRVDATVTAYGLDEVLFYGGTYPMLDVKGADLWAFNTTNYNWRLVNAQNVSADPGASDNHIGRNKHIAALDDSHENLIIAFGTTCAGQVLASTRRYNFPSNQWFDISEENDGQVAPGPRFGSASAVMNGALYIFGGQYDRNLRDLWRLSFANWKWMALDVPGQSFLSAASSRVSPTARYEASMTHLALTNQLLLFGGGHSDQQGDLHILSLDHFQVGTGSTACTRTNAMEGIAQPIGEHDVLSLMQLSPQVFSSTRASGVSPWFASSRISSVINYSQLIASGFAEIQLCPNSSDTDSISNMAHQMGVVVVNQPMRFSSFGLDSSSSSMQVPSTSSSTSTLDCSHTRCLTINTEFAFAPVEFIGISFVNGDANDGGSFLIANSSVAFTDCTFIGSRAQRGGAISAANTQLTINRCSFNGNSADVLGGAIYSVFSSIVLRDSTFENNQAVGSMDDHHSQQISMGGAGFHLTSSIDAARCNWVNNTAMRGGALLAASLVSVVPSSTSFATDVSEPVPTHPFVVVESIFKDNFASDIGGAIVLSHLFATSAQPTLINVTFIHNYANADGGGVYVDESLLSVQTSIFDSNSCGGSGGCVHWKPNAADPSLQFPPIIDDLTLQHQSNNSASYGAAQASVAVDLKLVDGSASLQLQSSGDLIRPPIILALVDAYGQTVATDNSTFVSILPLDSFNGVTSVRVVNGIANFSQLSFAVPPTLAVEANFSVSMFLPLLTSTQATGSLTMRLAAQPCQPGQRTTGQTCENCPAGSYSKGVMSSICTPCPSGSFTTEVGSTSCTLCAIGTAWSGQGLSTDCPDCTQKFFAWTEGSATCVECDVGLTCAARQGTANKGHWLLPLTVPVNGSWSPNILSDSDAVPVAHTVSCPYDNCLDNSTCGANRVMPAGLNPLCGACLDGFVGTESCVECTSVQWGKVVGIAVLFLAFTFVLHLLAQSSSSSGYLQLLFYFVQILLLELGGTRQMGNWASWLHVLDFNPSKAGGNTCIVPTNAYQRLAVDLFTPAILCAALFLLAVVHRALRLNKSEQSSELRMSAEPLAWNRRNSDCRSRSRSNSDAISNQPSVEETPSRESELRHSNSTSIQVERDSSLSYFSEASSTSSRLSVRNLKRRVCAELSRVSFDFVAIGRTLLSIFLFSYSSVTLTVMSHLICVDVGEGKQVVYFDPVMDCHSTEFKQWFVVIILFLIIFVVLAPIMIGMQLRRLHRIDKQRKLQIKAEATPSSSSRLNSAVLSPVLSASESESKWTPMQRLELSAPHASASPSLVAVDDPLREHFLPKDPSPVFDSGSAVDLQRMDSRLTNLIPSDHAQFRSLSITRLLIEPYRSHAYYFHIVILLRRAVFVALSAGLDSNPAAQYLSYGLWNMALLCVHLYIQPYREAEENVMETVNTVLLLFVSGLLQFTSASSISSKSTSALFPTWMQIIIVFVLVLPSAHMCRRILKSYWEKAKQIKRNNIYNSDRRTPRM